MFFVLVLVLERLGGGTDGTYVTHATYVPEWVPSVPLVSSAQSPQRIEHEDEHEHEHDSNAERRTPNAKR
ncbi:MAG TPA: hypothetical protein VK673_01275 [Chthoniobacterales bacterium]|nr:hypothetical protein [Chthoniobacterales bacterium]